MPTRTVTYLDDDEIAVVKPDGIEIFDQFLDKVKKEKVEVDWDISAADKGGYEHYMLKEIMEQPDAVSRTIEPWIKKAAPISPKS